MGRPKDRASAQGLLPRMEARPWADGKTVTYRYHPPGGKPLNLGTDRQAALRKVLDYTGDRDTHGTLQWVWEQLTKTSEPDEKARNRKVTSKPTKWERLSAGTRDDYTTAWNQIKQVFGDCHVSTISAADVARYVHVERADTPRRADIEKTVLSKLFGHAIKLGLRETNPCRDVEPHGSEARVAEPPSDELLSAFTAWMAQQTPQVRVVGLACEYAALAGNRKAEFLPLRWSDIDRKAREIRTTRAKQRGKKKGLVVEVISISDAMDHVLDRLWQLREARGAEAEIVFPTKDNAAYSARGFKTAWSRAVAAAIEQKVIPVDKRFTFHDLRAYYVSKHQRMFQRLPDVHANPATTARHYDRNREVERDSL
jgi:integrase